LAVLWPVSVGYTVALKPWRGSTRRERLPTDWHRLRVAVLKRADNRCQLQIVGCTEVAAEVDHIVPGDDHRLINLQACCKSCHKKKTVFENKARSVKKMELKKRPVDGHPGTR